MLAFVAYLDQLGEAVRVRDGMRILMLLRRWTASHLPREVREELLALARLPANGHRAPMAFLQFRHRMQQLAAGGEELPAPQTELPID
jgi:hypothetical protein